jgi:hypothetical protein
MAKDPAVLLYTSDFLSGTYTMTDEQVGKYIKLLCYQHQKGKLTEKDMLSICKGHDEDVYAKFDIVDGFYINKRMYEEAEKRTKFTESRRKNASAKHMLNHMPNHMEDEDENINEVKNVLVYLNTEFETIWKQWIQYKKDEHRDTYKSKKTEQIAINNLIRLCGGSVSVAAEIVNNSIANKYKGLFELKKSINTKPNDKLTQYQAWYADIIDNHENPRSEELPEIKKLGF